MMKIILHFLVLMFLFTVTMSEGSLSTIRLRKNIFHHIHRSIQDTVNKLFQLLHLKNNFTNDNKNCMLLSMHAVMKTITEQRFLKYKAAKKLVKLKKTRKPKKGNSNLEKLIHVVVEEKLIPDDTDSMNQTKKTGTKLKLTSAEIPKNPEESIFFLNQYLHYVEGFDVSRFQLPIKRTKELYKQDTLKKNRDAPSFKEVVNQGLSRRVFNGQPERSTKYPFIVSIHVLGNYTCTAAIVLTDWILTAATCLHIAYNDNNFMSTNPTGITVRIGSDYTDRSGYLCTANEIVFHPEYKPELLQNNIAMIKFDKLCARNSKKIRRIVYQNTKPDNTDNILLVGWAKNSNNIYYFDQLSSTHLDIYEFERCKLVYSSKYVSHRNFCAGYQKKGSGACQRDIGGPGIDKNILAGVVSFAPPICGTPDAPTVFTNISFYTQWIDSFSQKHQKTLRASVISNSREPLTLRKNNRKHLQIQRKYSKASATKLINHLLSGQDLNRIALDDLYDTDTGSIEINYESKPMFGKQENIYMNYPQKMKSYPQKLKKELRQISSSDEIQPYRPILQNSGNANPGTGSEYTETTTPSAKYIFGQPNGSPLPWKTDVVKEPNTIYNLSPAEKNLEEYSGSSESDSSESVSENRMSINMPSENTIEDGLRIADRIDTPAQPLPWMPNAGQNYKMFEDKTKKRFSLV